MIFLNVPGYENSGPGHWHTWLENTYQGFERVIQDDWLTPDRSTWLDRLDVTISSFNEPLFLVAHSCGSACAAQWLAERYRPESGVVGAVLVAPADIEQPVNLPEIGVQAPHGHGQFTIPVHIIASTNDPHCTPERSQELAERWGASIEFVQDGGHLATDDGYGSWDYLVDVIEHRSGQQFIRK